MTIEIKIPANALALQYHIGQALKAAAVDAGYNVVPESNSTLNDEALKIGIVRQKASVATGEFSSPETDTTTEQVDDTDIELVEYEPITPDTPDVDGIVWDKRIHSQGQTRNADNTWRLARKPKDKTEAEWNDYVEAVKAELLAVAAAEDSVTMTSTEQYGTAWEEHYGVDPVPPVTEAAVDPVPPVTETVADPVPPEPAADPVPPVTLGDAAYQAERNGTSIVDPLPPVTAQVDEQLTFAKVIAFATANKSKLPPMDELNKVYADLAASMGIPVTTTNAPIVAFAKAGPNVLSTLKATIEGLING